MLNIKSIEDFLNESEESEKYPNLMYFDRELDNDVNKLRVSLKKDGIQFSGFPASHEPDEKPIAILPTTQTYGHPIKWDYGIRTGTHYMGKPGGKTYLFLQGKQVAVIEY